MRRIFAFYATQIIPNSLNKNEKKQILFFLLLFEAKKK